MDAIVEGNRDPDVTVQKSAPFVRAGLVLFGARWKAPMARALGVTRETVSRWVSADDVPPWATKIARLMIANQGAVLSITKHTRTGESDIVFAAPPCTNLAVSGAHWFKAL